MPFFGVEDDDDDPLYENFTKGVIAIVVLIWAALFGFTIWGTV